MILKISLHLFPYLGVFAGSLARASADKTTAANVYGSFKHPAPIVRPRFRYWLPDGGADADAVAADIASAASIGAGGLEFLPFFEYGGSVGSMPPGANWSTYNFGTKPFRKLFKTALEAHGKHGLVMDFALGPNQGQGVPAHQDDQGLQWDLVPHTSAVSPNGSFTGRIPGWRTGKLVALVSALVLTNSTLQYETMNLIQLVNVTYVQYMLSHSSLMDHTSQVSATDGTVQLSFPPVSNGSHYRVFSFFEKRTLHKNLDFPSDKTSTIFDNGSYVVDHFSSRGAETVTRFWDQYMLKDGIAELITKVGNYAWEDSPEFKSNISWSPSIPSRFEKKFGYSLKSFLPLFAFKQNNIGMQSDSPGLFECILDTPNTGLGYVNDFRSTLTEGYSDYVKGLSDWAKRALDVEVSVQPGYGLPIDVMEVNAGVSAPECESLSFQDIIDTYRKFVGPAYLAGKRVISNELGAVRNAGFRYTIPDLLWSANRGFAGGINQFVIHGQAYTGDYYATTWPGHVAFAFLFSEPWSAKQPVWNYGLNEALGYMSRMQFVQQAGVPKVDVAIYNKESSTSFSTPSYQSSDLIKEGWTYNYLTSENLLLQQASVSKATLAPDGPAYRALVVESSQNVTVEALNSLKTYAKAGLPIIFSGGLPSFYPSGNGSKKLIFDDLLLSLSRTKNVHLVAMGQVASKLSSFQLEPRVRVATNGTWYTTWREAGTVDYIMVFADAVTAQGTVTIQTSKKPFFLNPWTGDSTPVLIYQENSGNITIPLSLKGNQTVIIVFADKLGRIQPPAYHVTKAPANILGAEYNAKRGITLHVAQSEANTRVGLSNGKVVDIKSDSISSKFEISAWSLVAEHWEAPENISEPRLPIVRFNTTHQLAVPTAWKDITSLSNSSGIGYYSCKFQWPHVGEKANTAAHGAYIKFSRVVNTLQLRVNGHRVPPLDPSNAAADITAYLQTGENEIIAIVPTTWWNYLRTILAKLKTAGSQPLPVVLESLIGLPMLQRDETGLVGGVTVVPYKTIHVENLDWASQENKI